jgi:hypothetical protein
MVLTPRSRVSFIDTINDSPDGAGSTLERDPNTISDFPDGSSSSLEQGLSVASVSFSTDPGESVDASIESPDSASSSLERFDQLCWLLARAPFQCCSLDRDLSVASVSFSTDAGESDDKISDTQDSASSSLKREFSVTLINFASDIGEFC